MRRFWSIPLLLLAACAAPEAEAGALALHVSPAGSDAAAGTREAPLKTLAAAASRARPGTTVYLHPGVYREPLVTRHAGLPDAPITYRGLAPGAVIDGSTLPWKPGANQNQGLVELRHAHSRLERIAVLKSKNTGVLLDADHLTVSGCEIAESQRHGLSTDTGRQTGKPDAPGPMIKEAVIHGNRIHHCTLAKDRGQDAGQALSLIADGFRVSENAVYDNRDIGIDVWLGATNGEVVDNRVSGNRAAGIYVDGARYVRIHRNTVTGNKTGIGVSSEDPDYETRDVWVFNNLVIDNRDVGCFLWDAPWAPGKRGCQDVLFAHNTLVGNRLAFRLDGDRNRAAIVNNLGYNRGTIEAPGADATLTIRDNLWLADARAFVDAAKGDYGLRPDAAAVDLGGAIPAIRDGRGRLFTPATDFAKRRRVVGAAPDVGAFEHGAGR